VHPSGDRSPAELLILLARRVKALHQGIRDASSELRPNTCHHCRRARLILDGAADGYDSDEHRPLF